MDGNAVDEIIGHAFGIKPGDVRVPLLSDTERRAYQAAWRIDREPMPETLDPLFCKSTRHARYIDYMAKIIREEMER